MLKFILISFIVLSELPNEVEIAVKFENFTPILGFKTKIVKKRDRIDRNFVTPICSKSFDLSSEPQFK